MKAIIIVSLLVPLALGDKLVNLEDIEKDNPQSDHHQNSPVPKPESDESNEQFDHKSGLGRYSFVTNHVEYNHGHGVDHNGDTRDNDDTYQVNEESPPAKSQSTHGYDYIPQIRVVPKIVKQIYYQGRQFYEWPRAIDDQYQGIQQQKGLKYVTQGHKGPVYVPTTQLLTYSPNLLVNPGLLRHFNTLGVQKVPSTVYVPSYGQTPPSTYSGYQSSIDPHPETVIPFKVVLTQPQTEYLQNHGDVNHLASYSGAPVYPQGQEISYVQGQSVQQNHYDHKPKKLYSIRVAKPVYRTQSEQSGELRHLKVPEPSSHTYTSPAITKQQYQSNNVHPSRDDDNLYVQNHLNYESQPKSLLGSYVPSHIIAAQDTARYRERPIKLESGFLPSKMNFFHTYPKRKSNSI